MNSDRIKEIQMATAYPDSQSVQQALLQVWNECQQERSYSEEDMAESFMACWKANVSDGIECKLSFKEWLEQFKKK
jgi:hypothetical protein